jgi:hypothetical protein
MGRILVAAEIDFIGAYVSEYYAKRRGNLGAG